MWYDGIIPIFNRETKTMILMFLACNQIKMAPKDIDGLAHYLAKYGRRCGAAWSRLSQPLRCTSKHPLRAHQRLITRLSKLSSSWSTKETKIQARLRGSSMPTSSTALLGALSLEFMPPIKMSAIRTPTLFMTESTPLTRRPMRPEKRTL